MSNQTTTHHVKMTTASIWNWTIWISDGNTCSIISKVRLNRWCFTITVGNLLGGFAQIFACIHDAKHNNTFGTTAFGAYGLFWLGVGMTWLIQLGVFGEKLAQAQIQNSLV